MVKNVAALLALACLASAAVTNLKAEFRGGKTFITFTEDANTAVRYNLYRSETPITTVTGLAVLVNLAYGSGRDPNFGTAHVITDLGAPLPLRTGLFVYTPKADRAAYYAVTTILNSVEDKTLATGVNVLSSPVQEQYWKAPLGVLTQIKDSTFYIYYYWMDYSAWPNSREYYGNFYNIAVEASVRGKTGVPLYVYLHALNSGTGMPNEAVWPTTYALRTNDPNNTWWFGSGSDNYTERRVLAYIAAACNDPRFSVDTNRIYLHGQSMGGKGTLTVGLRHPEIFACIVPFLPPIDTSMTNIMVRNPAGNFPPITDYFGSKDSPEFGMAGHRLLFQTCIQTHNGVWSQWGNHGHQPAGNPATLVFGSFLRFRKNELFPAFTSSTKDWNYGVPNPAVYDSIGAVNSYIDWTSSLHDMGLANDDLVDCADSIVITAKSPLAGTLVDVTPRRVQHFRAQAGNSYDWRNTDVATDTLVASGTVKADANGLITVKAVALCRTGNRLVIQNNGGNRVAPSLSCARLPEAIEAGPNPFTSQVSFSVPEAANSVVLYSVDGKKIARFGAPQAGGKGRIVIQWHAAGFPAGAYTLRAALHGRTLVKRIVLIR